MRAVFAAARRRAREARLLHSARDSKLANRMWPPVLPFGSLDGADSLDAVIVSFRKGLIIA